MLGFGQDEKPKLPEGIFGRMSDPMKDRTLKFSCQKCGFKTAGIYQKIEDIERRCPLCGSLFMFCQVCRTCTSGTEKYQLITCDNCHTEFVTEHTIESIVSQDRGAREIVLSGIRATGRLHLGNYLGAVRQFVEYERGGHFCLYFIADWHTLTTCQDPQKISNNLIEIATDYLAAGLNPDVSIIYAQSSVPEIAELALYLAMFQSKNQVESMPTLKDIVRNADYISMGHLYYPVLMAADILGPRATVVPVGSDQVPNVELAIGLAKKFNALFGPTFVVPKVGLRTIKIPGLTGEKMGKSNGSSAVSLDDSLEQITEKYFQYGVTDPGRKTRNDHGNPDVCASVYPIHKILNEENSVVTEKIASECRAGTRGCKECKIELAKSIDAAIQPFREKRAELTTKQEYVREVLHFGGLKAREIIRPTLELVRAKLGIDSR